jgi:hypothetical protein
MAPGCVLTTSLPFSARDMASRKAAILVMVYGSELGSLVTGASSRSSPPAVSKKVPVLTATTRPRSTASPHRARSWCHRCSRPRSRPGSGWPHPAARRSGWRSRSPRRPHHGVGIGDVAGDHLDPERRQRRVSAVSRASARTWSPRSSAACRCWRRPGRWRRSPGPSDSCRRLHRSSAWRVDLVGAVGDDRLARPVQVQRVQEAVQAHGVGAGESQLDDLRRREVLAQLAVGLVVDGVDGRRRGGRGTPRPAAPAPSGRRRARGDEAGDVLVGDGVVLPRLLQGWHSPSWALRMRNSSSDAPAEEGVLPVALPRHVDHHDL